MYLKRAAKRPWYVRDDSQFRPAGRRHLRAPASPRQRSLHSMCALLPFLLSPAFSGKENTQVAYGFKLQESSTKSAESCARLCENFTSHVMGTEHDCEAWTFDTKGLCTLRQLTGKAFISHVGDLTAVSWKRHANFKNDCTPLWVDIAGKDYRQVGVSGTQQARDLSCCQACQQDPECDVWAQATDSDDVNHDKCYLKAITKTQTGDWSGVRGVPASDADFSGRKPKPYFAERRSMRCEDVVSRVSCGPQGAGPSECQSYGCCWEDTYSASSKDRIAADGNVTAARSRGGYPTGESSIASADMPPSCFRSRYRPVVMMHGMGSPDINLLKNIHWLWHAFPGIYVKDLNVYPGYPSQETAMDRQLMRVNQSVVSDPMLHEGFNFYGESQGALLARVYVSELNNPPVHNLIALSGPQAGVGACPRIEGSELKHICEVAAPIIDIYHWPRCSFCGYWKGQDKKQYLTQNQWLKDINNEVSHKDLRRAERMKSLNAYMASAASGDQVVQPKESAWHSYWQWGGPRSNALLLNQTEGYLGDWLGLRTLDSQGKLTLNMYQGGHLEYEPSWWLANILPMLNNTF